MTNTIEHTYSVRWHLNGTELSVTTRVIVIDGYTTVNDIDRIIATNFGLDNRSDVCLTRYYEIASN